MATGKTATGPDSPVGSSPLRKSALPALVGWFKETSDFIRSLTPSTATEFESVEQLTITNTSNFSMYSGNSLFAVHRYGKSIEVYGDITCTTVDFITGVEGKHFATLPTDCRPTYQQRQLVIGHGPATWLLTINTDGRMYASRHTDTQPSGVWLPINITFITA